MIQIKEKTIDDVQQKVHIMNKYEYLIKLLVIGDAGVGKTSLIARFADYSFLPSYTTTVGLDFKSKIVQYDSTLVKLQIWDTAGQQKFRTITQSYYRGAAGILLTFSLIDRASFDHIEKWLMQIEGNAPKGYRKVLVGTKSDQVDARVVTSEMAVNLANKAHIKYLETSSKNNEGVSQAFLQLGRQAYQVKSEPGRDNQKIKLSSQIFSQKEPCSCKC